MAAGDETFFNLRRMHVLFAGSAAALLAATVWLLAVDHARPWKGYQRTYRQQLEPWLTEARLRAAEAEDLSVPAGQHGQPELRQTIEQLRRQLAQQQPHWAKRLFGLPLVDAFGRPLSIEQIWLPELTIDYHFRQVARFDRCVTCHQAIQRSVPGAPADPAFPRQQSLALRLQPPKTSIARPDEAALEQVLGLVLAECGWLDSEAVTVQQVRPRSPAAVAQLLPGDVLLAIDGQPVIGRSAFVARLLEGVAAGRAMGLEVRRGLPHPYNSHPRLDLFVGESSPHPMSEFGCTICHDGQGSGTDFGWAAHTPNDLAQRARWQRELGWFANPHWDLPMLPARFAESRCLKCHHQVSDLEPSRRFPDPPAAKLLAGYQLVRQNGCFGCHEIKGYDDRGQSVGPDMRLESLGAEEKAGADTYRLRKVGPSLRNVATRLSSQFLPAVVADPAAFRPQSRMPRLFGLHEHLDASQSDAAQQFEAVELQAITAYLQAVSEPVELLPTPAEVTEAPSAERGRRLFRIQGCLACHRHPEFPDGQSLQGPELGNLGAKYADQQSRQWLTSWIRDPLRHAPRTRMPIDAGAASDGNSEGVSDPAADLAAWLTSYRDWKPPSAPALSATDLDQLALQHLAASFPAAEAAEYLQTGIPASRADQVQGDERLLQAPLDRQKKLQYVGRRTIRKRGCFGCHDIPGLEDAAPIGPALSDWGRKQLSLLAFEQINGYVARQESPPAPTASAADRQRQDFFREALLAHRREGFLWQKLHAPRSFDYQKAGGKRFNEQLKMGRFTLTDEQCEQIATFVLGLVAEPPAARYVARPAPPQQAIVAGRKVLDELGCAQCHTLEMERWTIEYDPHKFAAPPAVTDYAFLKPQIDPAVVAASQRPDRRGLCRVELVGMPRVDAKGQLQEDEDEEGRPLYAFGLWEPAAIAGQVCSVGGAEVLVGQGQIVARRPPQGGALARLLFPEVLAEARAAGATGSQAEAWGWVPPALAYLGRAVQPQWMYDYLLQPSVIRPAAVLRMPKYNLSPQEARRLVDYFAASAGVEFPYSSSASPAGPPAAADAARRQRMNMALQILRDRTTYCAKCHLVGTYGPGGQSRSVLAPNLDQVGRRIRPDYLRRWLANPQSALPYTAMPVNFPPSGPPLGQDLLPGSSQEQLDAVLDLLLNYDWYHRQ